MEQHLVSILMPVLNGEKYLPYALDSLLNQDYQNFELIILDNMSTDRTAEICLDAAGRDKRVLYICDNRNRITHDANSYLITFARGEYCTYASDDDLWDPKFLSILVKELDHRPNVALAFCNAIHIDVEGNKNTKPILRKGQIYREDHSKFSNFWNFLCTRGINPTFNGIFRTSALREVLPFRVFDETIANVDNLLFLDFLSKFKIHGRNEILFYVRNKYRAIVPELLKEYPQDNNKWKIWLYFAKHQWKFTKLVIGVIKNSEFSQIAKFTLMVRAVYAFVLFITFKKMIPGILRFLEFIGLRERKSVKVDEHYELRANTLKKMNYQDLVAESQGIHNGSITTVKSESERHK